MYKENIKDMDSFIERFCAKYYFPYAEGRQLIEGMEYKTYRKGDCGSVEISWGLFFILLSSTYKCNFLGADNKQ